MEFGEARRFEGKLSWNAMYPNCTIKKTIVFIAKAPELSRQTNPKTSLSIVGSKQVSQETLELSPLKRQIYYVFDKEYNDPHKIVAQAKYEATLLPMRLVKGGLKKVIAPLTQTEETLNLRASDNLNYSEPTFQTWLDTNKLRKQDESDMEFAWRSFSTIRKLYTYNYVNDQDRHISKLCQERSTDCGGVSLLFVGTLRANGVPSRCLFGRWAKSDISKLGGAHVKSEFYATGVGWVPVELSSAISYKTADSAFFFGRDEGNFFAFHIDPDLELDTILFGKHNIRNMQSPTYWVRGTGKFEGKSTFANWEVREILETRTR